MLLILSAWTLVPAVEVATRAVTVVDLLRDAHGARPRGMWARRTVFRVAPTASAVTMSGASVAAAIARVAPGVAITDRNAVHVVRRGTGRSTQACWAALRALPVGQAVTTDDVSPSRCASDRPAAVRALADGTPVLAEAVAAGAMLGRLHPAAPGRIPRQATLTLRTHAGQVLIEREVVAMQPGRAGHLVFVRGADGRVFAAPLAAEGRVP